MLSIALFLSLFTLTCVNAQALGPTAEIKDNGQISGVEILQPSGEIFNQAIREILSNMPKWKPATENNLPSASGPICQLKFRLEQLS